MSKEYTLVIAANYHYVHGAIGAPYHAQMSIFYRTFIRVGPSLYQVQ